MFGLKKRDLTDQVIWVTGASQGIGERLAVSLVERNAKVIVSARNLSKLEALASNYENIVAVEMDVTKVECVKTAAEKIQTKFGKLDILVANAGTCEYLDVKEFDTSMIERVVNTNFFGLVRTVEASLPLLRKATRPYIVGMSSTVAYLGLPRAQAYGSSKAAVSYFLDSMRSDLSVEGFKVSSICPGFVKTPLTDQNDFDMPFRISAEEAGEAIAKGIEKESFEIHFPKRFSLMFKFIASLPKSWKFKITQGMSRNTGPVALDNNHSA